MVVICVDGQALEEYLCEEEKPSGTYVEIAQQTRLNDVTISKYIESYDDKEFTIKINVREPYKFDCPNLGFSTAVDGIWVEVPLLGREDWNDADKKWTRVIEGPSTMFNKKTARKPMKFAGLKTCMLASYKRLIIWEICRA
jgi:hypothetical protein